MKMKTKSIVLKGIFLFIAASVSLSSFAKKSDFSGTWTLNETESKMNAEFSFAPLVITITQEKNAMNLEREYEFQGNAMTMSDSYTLDGKESINAGWQDSETVSIATWGDKGKSLTIVTTVEMMDGGELKIYATYKLDGKSLVVDSKVEGGPMDGPPETWVYDQQ